MKRLLYLLPLYILLLSAIPCQADDGCCIDEAITTAAHHKNSLPDNKSSLPCSPFFACGACHGFIVPQAGVMLQHKEIPSAPKLSLPASNTLPGFTTFIWQPPRIS
ncbi:MAG TPA: hypothetical protein VHC96_18110 [Puia sp.]|jgi:hypothetical protein|nr:hypothetical protein [Puia sp.]